MANIHEKMNVAIDILIKQMTIPFNCSRQMDASPADLAESGREDKRPRFQLCFSTNDMTTSKTNILKATHKLWGLSLPILTPKFYSPNGIKFTEEDDKEVEELVKKLELIDRLGPREKYKEPILESHRYGWFQESFIERKPHLDRVHFPKNTSNMVKIQNLFAQFKSKIGDRCD